MAEEWFLQIGKKRHGPFTLDQLKRMAQADQLRESDLLWKEGLAKPVTATTVAGVFSYAVAKKKVRDPETAATGATTAKGFSYLPVGMVVGGLALGVIAFDAIRPTKRASQVIPGNGFGQKVAPAPNSEEVPHAPSTEPRAGEEVHAKFKRNPDASLPVPIVPVGDLVSEYQRSPAAARDRFEGKELIVTGLVDYPLSLEKDFGVFLKTPTAGGLKLVARFPTTHNPDAQRLAVGNAVAVRGVCAGMLDDGQAALHQAVQLMDCEAVDPAALEKVTPRPGSVLGQSPGQTPGMEAKPTTEPVGGRVLTDSYFPLKAGRELLYDVAVTNGAVTSVKRYRCVFSDGRVDRETIKLGTLVGGSLLQGGQVKWFRDVKIKDPFPIHLRGNREYVEFGTHMKGDAQVYWEPILKLGTKPGDHWDWHGPEGVFRYEFLRVDRHKGRPAVVVQTTMPPEDAPLVTTHLYVEGVGEVERNTTKVGSGAVLNLIQTRLVEDEMH